MAVVDEHRAAGVVHVVIGDRDHAVGGRPDRRALGSGDIDAVVRPARLAVEHPLAAEHPGDRALDRPDEAALEQRLGAVDRARLGDARVLGADARQHRLGRRDHLGRQAVDALDLVVALGDRQAARLDAAVGPGHLERGLGRGIAAEAEDEAARLGDANAAPLQGHPGARRRLSEDQAALNEVALERELPGPDRRAGERERERERQQRGGEGRFHSATLIAGTPGARRRRAAWRAWPWAWVRACAPAARRSRRPRHGRRRTRCRAPGRA